MSRKKIGSIALAIELTKMRERRARTVEQQQAVLATIDAAIAKKVKELKDSGAGITVMAEAYGTKDRATIIDIIREQEATDAEVHD